MTVFRSGAFAEAARHAARLRRDQHALETSRQENAAIKASVADVAETDASTRGRQSDDGDATALENLENALQNRLAIDSLGRQDGNVWKWIDRGRLVRVAAQNGETFLRPILHRGRRGPFAR